MTLNLNDISLEEMLKQLNYPLSRTAVKVNNRLIKKINWPTTTIQENDNIQTVLLVSGG